MFGSFKRSLPPLLGFAAVVCLPLSASAIQPPKHLQGRAELELAPTVSARFGAGKTTHRGIWAAPRVGPRARGFARLEAELGADIQARFDADTGVLDTLIPAGFVVAGASRSPAIAEQFALDFLARHIDLLAPGSSVGEFKLVSDDSSNGVRSIGLVQTQRGLAVIGGQLSFRFKNDRLIAVRSQALANVSLAAGPSTPASRISAPEIEARAQTWVAKDFANGRLADVRVAGPIEGPMILPLVGQAGVDYREVLSAEIELVSSPGRWQVYLDATTGAPIARRSLLRWAGLEYTVWQRSPLGSRVEFPAAYVEATIDDEATVTDPDGALGIPVSGATAGFGTDGVYVRVYNDNGPVSSVATPMTTEQVFVWDLGPEPEQDAQLNAYVHAQVVKDYVRSIDPEFPNLDLETRVTVNINETCNAFADDNTLNFYLSGGGCENSALIADVVYHEYGHVAHDHGIIPGVGLFDGAHSEGAGDYLSATIIDDPSVGRGFFLDTDAPIRELDPEGYEWHWPEDTGEVHNEGRIIAGTLWDLRKAMIEKYGVVAGVTKTDLIWMDGIRRAVDIPSTYLEALISNDDDGNLQNGTPDICEINQAFAAHGLYEPPGSSDDVTRQTLADGSVEVTLEFGQPFAGCPQFVDPSAVVRFRPRAEPNQPVEPATELTMSLVDVGTLQVLIPPQPVLTVTQFQVELDWGNGTVATRPDNFGDPWYESFNGEATEIWCTGFEDEASIDAWSLTGEFDWGTPEGGSGDPGQAYEGSFVAGIRLDWPGLYAANQSSTLRSPSVDVSGFEVVRLQYRRWLNVEDGYWDHATISANDELAWANYASPTEVVSDVHHRDREWRFHDVVLTPYVDADGHVELEWGLVSDGGLELGGWNIDQLCIVGHGAVASGGCGDGYVQEFEQCDDGNLDNGDGCSSGCLIEDDEPSGDMGDTGELAVDDIWGPDGRGCGCVTTSTTLHEPGGFAGLIVLGLFVRLRRRRRS